MSVINSLLVWEILWSELLSVFLSLKIIIGDEGASENLKKAIALVTLILASISFTLVAVSEKIRGNLDVVAIDVKIYNFFYTRR